MLREPRWPSGNASTSKAGDSGSLLALPGRVIPVTSKSVLCWLPCQAPSVIASVLGLVRLVSVHCDRVR